MGLLLLHLAQWLVHSKCPVNGAFITISLAQYLAHNRCSIDKYIYYYPIKPLAWCLAHSRGSISRCFCCHSMNLWHHAWHIVGVITVSLFTMPGTCVLHRGCGCPLPKTYCVPGRCSPISEHCVLGQPSRSHPPISPLVDTPFFWVRLLFAFGPVLFVIIFFFIFSFPSFVSPPPPCPSHLPSPPPRSPPLPIEPSAPPQDVKCVSTRSTAILVSWRPPPPETHNGALVSYSVRYRPLGSEDPQPKEVNGIPPTTTQILLEALDKWTEYRITTVAHTEVGPGPESSPVVIRTDEDGKHRPGPGNPRRPQPAPALEPPVWKTGLAGSQKVEAILMRGRHEASSLPKKSWAP